MIVILNTLEVYTCKKILTGADCVPIGSSGLTHLVVSDNAELNSIPVTSSRVKVVKQQVLLCLCIRVCLYTYHVYKTKWWYQHGST